MTSIVGVDHDGARTGDASDAPAAGPVAALPLVGAGLEDLLREMLQRVEDVVADQDRLRLLLDAVVVLAADLTLDGVLARIVKVACDLSGARYAAIGVLGGGSAAAGCRRS